MQTIKNVSDHEITDERTGITLAAGAEVVAPTDSAVWLVITYPFCFEFLPTAG